MKKFITIIAIFICTSIIGATYAQDVLVPVKKSCVVEDTEYALSDAWIMIDTTFVCGDSLKFSTYGVDGLIDYSFPITRIDRQGDKCTYRCNPLGNKESACLTTYNDKDCYAVLRKRTLYGQVVYKFLLN